MSASAIYKKPSIAFEPDQTQLVSSLFSMSWRPALPARAVVAQQFFVKLCKAAPQYCHALVTLCKEL
jgi:hypothetical protein